MMAMASIREGNIDEGRAIYSELLKTPNLPEALKMRVQDMLSVLDEAE